VLWDLERPLEKSVKLELLDFEHPEGAYMHLTVFALRINSRHQAKKFSGIPLPIFSVRLPNVTTVVTYVSVLPRTKAFSMRWALTDRFPALTTRPSKRWQTRP
jgi:hypothetical protein